MALSTEERVRITPLLASLRGAALLRPDSSTSRAASELARSISRLISSTCVGVAKALSSSRYELFPQSGLYSLPVPDAFNPAAHVPRCSVFSLFKPCAAAEFVCPLSPLGGLWGVLT